MHRSKPTSQRTTQIAAALVIIALPVLFCVLNTRGVALRDGLDAYEAALNTPMVILFPLMIVPIALWNLDEETKDRFIVYTRPREPLETHLRRVVATACGTAAMIGFFYAFVAFLAAYYVLPALDIVHFSPGAYGLSAQAASATSPTRDTFSQFLTAGPFAYGILYSLWVAACSAIYALLGSISILVLPNRVLAFAAPFLLAAAETFAAQAVGTPQYALWTVVFPFGLEQSAIWVPVIPMALLLVAGATSLTVLLRKPHALASLN